MSHRKLQELLGAYHDGELRGGKRDRVEKHLKSCPECRRDLEFLRALDAVPRTSPSVPQEAEYWASFSGRVRARIARRQAGAPTSQVLEVRVFKDVFFKPDKNRRLRAAIFPMSLAAHAIIIALLIMIPLMKTGELPKVEVYSAFLAPPPPPPPPP